MSSVAGESVGGLLGHKVWGLRVEVYFWRRFLFRWRVGFVSSGSYSYPSGSCRSNFINSISWKRNEGAAQSKPTLAKSARSRLGSGRNAARSKVVKSVVGSGYCRCGSHLLSVPLELI